MTSRIRHPAAVLAALLLVSACSLGEDGPDEPSDQAAQAPDPAAEPDTTLATTTTTVRVPTAWRCGEIKQKLLDSIAPLGGIAREDAQDGGEAAAEPRVLTSLDQAALNLACELYGQHDAAVELWQTGNRGDACDVWDPAQEAATAAILAVGSVSELAPMVAHLWIGATGDVAEGYGRCIAERAN